MGVVGTKICPMLAMTGGDSDRPLSFRGSDRQRELLDGLAERGGVSRSELIRRMIDFAAEAQDDIDDVLPEDVVVQGEIDDKIDQNRLLRRLLPSKWRAHVRGLFVEDLRDNTHPDDLRTLAEGYREQAALMEEQAALVDEAPNDPDLVGIVDEELAAAMEAADLSTYYDVVENPHERHLEGVGEGREERQNVIMIVTNLVESWERMAETYNDPAAAPVIKPKDLPERAGSELPDRVEREDVAELANSLVRSGVSADQVADVLGGETPALDDAEEIETELLADGGQQPDDDSETDSEKDSMNPATDATDETETETDQDPLDILVNHDLEEADE